MNKKNLVDDGSTNEAVLWVRPSTKRNFKRKKILNRIIKDWLYQKYIREKLSVYKISNIAGIKSAQTVYNWLHKFKIPIRVRDKNFYRGERNSNWKGGKRIKSGYLQILKPEHPFSDSRGYVYKHRLVMEKKLGRYLKPEETIHHKNGKKRDNREKNLGVFNSRREHLQFHKKLKKEG